MQNVFCTTFEVDAQPINVPIGTCLSDYTCTHFTIQNSIKQTLRQKPKLKLVSHHKDRYHQQLQTQKQNYSNKSGEGGIVCDW
jgi:hypothetical protein